MFAVAQIDLVLSGRFKNTTLNMTFCICHELQVKKHKTVCLVISVNLKNIMAKNVWDNL